MMSDFLPGLQIDLNEIWALLVSDVSDLDA